ncbi:hypothetical protein [Methylophilus sp. YYY-1]|uniref:hypothetical protein n=1 Tax=Methylophilus sp. YYY-1 TaxID=2682087 RepID=UPI0023B341AB|nr:hypothetical protein [Methylophilus sp. YYY-1]
MNINFSFKCKTCNEITNARVGLSNRDVQPFKFSCQSCGSPIELNLTQTSFESINGAEVLEETLEFDEKTSFVDLHLDFPVSFAKYQMGLTPFMRAIQRIGFENYAAHNHRLNALNQLYRLSPELRQIINQYSKNIELFSRLCESKFGVKVKSTSPQDINAALYMVIAKVFFAFAMPNDNAEAVEKYSKITMQLSEKNKNALDNFIKEIIDTGFLKNIQEDCLEIYPKLLEAELPMRPALFLDFDANYQKELVAFRVSTDDFQMYKDLYKDISEIMSRQLVLVAGINNLIHRGNHNEFKEIGKHTPASLHDYADVAFGLKISFLDDSWYVIDDGVADNQLRNSIAHYKAEYDDITQLITYFPRKEGIKQEKSEQMYFIDFMRKILISYREMHRLHQLIKCLFNYYFFIYKK